MTRTRDQSNIFNGEGIITPHDESTTGLTIREKKTKPYQVSPLLTLDRVHGQFQPAEVIDFSMNLWVTKTGSDSDGNGTYTDPWATPQKAMEWLHKRSIVGADTIVTIRITAGEYTLTSSIVSEHPNGNKINFLGDDLLGNKPAGIPIADWETDYSSPVIPASTQDNFSNSAGTLSVFKNDADRSDSSDLDKSLNEILIKSRYTTILTFPNETSGFRAVGGNIGKIDKIAIFGSNVGANGFEAIGDSYAVGSTKVSGARASIFIGSDVAIHGFETGIYAHNGHIEVDNYPDLNKIYGISITGCGDGIISENNSSVITKGSTIQGYTKAGILVRFNSSVSAEWSEVSGGLLDGVYAEYNSTIVFDNSVSAGNGNTGIKIVKQSFLNGHSSSSIGNYSSGYVANSGDIDAFGLTSTGNRGTGIDVYYGSNVRCHSDYGDNGIARASEVVNNGTHGIYAYGKCYVRANNMKIQRNYLSGIYAREGSTIDARSAYSAILCDCSNNGENINAKYPQIRASWNSVINCIGTTIGGGSTYGYYFVMSGYNSSIYLSGGSSLETTIQLPTGNNDGYPLILAWAGGMIEDWGSYPISSSPGNAAYYSPLGNTVGDPADGEFYGYNRVLAATAVPDESLSNPEPTDGDDSLYGVTEP